MIRFVALETWPGSFTKSRKPSPFKAGYSSTVKLLERELAAVTATNVVVQLAMLPGQIKANGLPYADSKPSHPGVILSFQKRSGDAFSFPCDRFQTWQENLRAIALALDALRRVDRYGVTQNGEQYRGWAKLPPPAAKPASRTMTVEAAAMFVAIEGGGEYSRDTIRSRPDAFQNAYRRAALKLHPDRNGGQQRPEWHTLQQAKAVLDKHLGN